MAEKTNVGMAVFIADLHMEVITDEITTCNFNTLVHATIVTFDLEYQPL